jgi:hypothetical protein
MPDAIDYTDCRGRASFQDCYENPAIPVLTHNVCLRGEPIPDVGYITKVNRGWTNLLDREIV